MNKMSFPSNPISSSVSNLSMKSICSCSYSQFCYESSFFPEIGAGNWIRRGGEKERGMLRTCRCGQSSVIRTSGTSKISCCPNGSKGVRKKKSVL